MEKISDIKFKVKFDDGTMKMLTAKQIADLNDKRRWIVYGKNDKIIMRKTYRG